MSVKEVDFLGECGFRADFLRAKNLEATIGMPPDVPAFTFGATPPPPVFPVPRNKEEADLRSVSVGQVDCSAKPEDLSNAFASCGTVNRVRAPKESTSSYRDTTRRTRLHLWRTSVAT